MLDWLFFLISIPIVIGTTITASRKGFNPVIWFFAGSIVGLIVVSNLSSAKAYEEDDDGELERRRRRGNKIGIILAVISSLPLALISTGMIAGIFIEIFS